MNEPTIIFSACSDQAPTTLGPKIVVLASVTCPDPDRPGHDIEISPTASNADRDSQLGDHQTMFRLSTFTSLNEDQFANLDKNDPETAESYCNMIRVTNMSGPAKCRDVQLRRSGQPFHEVRSYRGEYVSRLQETIGSNPNLKVFDGGRSHGSFHVDRNYRGVYPHESIALHQEVVARCKAEKEDRQNKQDSYPVEAEEKE